MSLLCRQLRRRRPHKGLLIRHWRRPIIPAVMTIYDRTLARMSRRELMKVAWILGAAAIARPVLTRRVLAKPIFDAYPFPLGVASGDPVPAGIVLWTRLAPKPL